MNKYNQADCNLKAIGIYIFGGSQTIAHLQCGWKINEILEMTEDMIENNSYHFVKNYPLINVLKPSQWNNNYLNIIAENEYDLLFSNNPCSGLSSINRNANVNQPVNKRFFEVFEIINKLKPKVFLIENAPQLVSIGTPLLHKMVEILKDNYNFTIIRDFAGNHNVAMRRQRTLLVGWRVDIFKNRIPIINPNKQLQFTVRDALSGLNENIPNMEFEKNTLNPSLTKYYNLVKPGNSVMRAIAENIQDISDSLDASDLAKVNKLISKQEENKNIWDKSAWRLKNDDLAGSITSLAQYIHPTEDRELYIREYARLMGYPDDFIFYPNECKCSTIQCIAQGVPVNFIKYISNEIKRCLTEHYNYINDSKVVFQHHSRNKLYKFSYDDFLNVERLSDIKENPVDIINF